MYKIRLIVSYYVDTPLLDELDYYHIRGGYGCVNVDS